MRLRFPISLPAAWISLAPFLLASLIFAAPARAQRLGDNVVPAHYAITLAPDLKAATFTGSETIDVLIKTPTKEITLNAIEIEFQSVRIAAGGKEQTASVTLDKEKEQATFTVPGEIPAGKASLSIQFTGILNNELRGFYLSKTARRNYAVTQFESTDARRAFPCFDEPAMKATFDVSLVVDSADSAITNTPIAADTPGPGEGKHTLHFAPTPKMSTYLLAFLVGDFECTHGEQDGVAIGVCSTPDKVALTAYGVEIAKFVLHYYNTYFGIPYPLKKLDLIGLPDFEAGAMENFGAITYREDALLLDPKTASLASKKGVASVIAHEMAHQWFGDLVTMEWWNNIWLNEGFATWMSYKPIAAMHPDWDFDQQAIAGTDGSLDLDSRATTRAIRAQADTPAEINQMFDGITYGKAAAVLLMVENYVGKETFRQGVHKYLAAHLYANATAEDFWGAQTATSHKPVDKIMESLVAQPGVPILTFGAPSDGSVHVGQRRFFLSPSIKPDAAQKWTLPVCFKAADNGRSCDVLTPTGTQLKVPPGSIFYPNAGGTGYYRTAYTPETFKTLAEHAETSLIPSERIRLLGDRWAQLRANDTTVGDDLDLVAELKADSSAEVISKSAADVEAVFVRVAATPEERNGLAAWIRATFSPELAKLGAPSPDDTANKIELRAELFALLGLYGKDPAVIAQAREIAEKYIADPGSLDATLGQTALGIAARNGDAVLFDQLQKIYETSTNPEIQQSSLRLLSQFEDPALARRDLDYAVSGKVRNQDAIFQFSGALQVPATRDLAWNYVQQNWDKVQAQFTTFMGADLVESTGAFCTADARADVEKFFADHKVADSSVGLRHALDRIDSCVEFRQLQEENLRHWLAAHPQP
jgi:aminopeptidase N/puromycin-sensitive aminopeptidase